MAVVLDNMRRVSGASVEFVLEKQIEHGAEHIERLPDSGARPSGTWPCAIKRLTKATAGPVGGDLGTGSAGVNKA